MPGSRAARLARMSLRRAALTPPLRLLAQVMFAITSIKGIGRRLANVACKKAEVDLAKRAGELSASELESLMVVVSNPRQFRVPDWFLNRRVAGGATRRSSVQT
jgi:ribosomal protein S13